MTPPRPTLSIWQRTNGPSCSRDPYESPTRASSRRWGAGRSIPGPVRELRPSRLPELGVEDLVEADVHDVHRADDHRDARARRDEPPPHAEVHRAPLLRVVEHQAERDAVGRP